MKRILVKLSELKPNPYKQFIQGGMLSEEVIKQIMESAERTSFWEQWVVREVKSGYELAFGHNRLEAARRLLGRDVKVSVQIETYTDAQMFTAMADENTGEAQSWAQRVDVIKKARQLLESNSKWCKYLVQPLPQGKGLPKNAHLHEHGSIECIRAFLGEENWSLADVSRLIKLADYAEPQVIEAMGGLEGRRHLDAGEIGRDTAIALSELPASVQRAAVKAIKAQPKPMSGKFVQDAIEEVKAKPTVGAIESAIERKAKAQATEERKRKEKQEAKGKPKAKAPLPDLKGIIEGWAIHIDVLTEEVRNVLAPNVEALVRDDTRPSFEDLHKAVRKMAELLDELRPKKAKIEPIRTAEQVLEQLNP